ncbi:MAG TPA: hypothetical protein PLK80_13370, partial [bacterium]|nr:hypothetical protein [bacterium]
MATAALWFFLFSVLSASPIYAEQNNKRMAVLPGPDAVFNSVEATSAERNASEAAQRESMTLEQDGEAKLERVVTMLKRLPMFAGYGYIANAKGEAAPELSVVGEDGKVAMKFVFPDGADGKRIDARDADGALKGIIVFDETAKAIKVFDNAGQLLISLDYSAVSEADGTGRYAFRDDAGKKISELAVDDKDVIQLVDGKPVVVISRQTGKTVYYDKEHMRLLAEEDGLVNQRQSIVFKKGSISIGWEIFFL